jgi:hypothetical protein
MPRDKMTLETILERVSELFFDKYAWSSHPSCIRIDQRPGARTMLIKRVSREIESREEIAEMDKLGYRPANLLEAYAFARQNPGLQLRFDIGVLGSYTYSRNGDYCIPKLAADDQGRRWLTYDYYEREYGMKLYPDQCFLFVRKSV